jgi:hypothetical protein
MCDSLVLEICCGRPALRPLNEILDRPLRAITSPRRKTRRAHESQVSLNQVDVTRITDNTLAKRASYTTSVPPRPGSAETRARNRPWSTTKGISSITATRKAKQTWLPPSCSRTQVMNRVASQNRRAHSQSPHLPTGEIVMQGRGSRSNSIMFVMVSRYDKTSAITECLLRNKTTRIVLILASCARHLHGKYLRHIQDYKSC